MCNFLDPKMIAIIISFVILIFYLYHLSTRNFDYWEKKNIPYIKPLPLVGNYGPYITLKKYIGEVIQSLCNEYPFAPYIGVYFGKNPTLIIQDPNMLKLIMTKDFYYFTERENGELSHKETFLSSLFFINGDVWKVLRQHTSPLFSSAKIKTMFEILKKSVIAFEKTLHDEIKPNKSVQVRKLLLRYTLNGTGNCIFGIDTKTLEKDVQNNPYISLTNKMFQISTERSLKIIGRTVYPNFFYGLGLRNVPLVIDHFFKKYLKDLYKGGNSIKSRGFNELLNKMKTDNVLIGDSIENTKGDNNKVKLNLEDSLSLGLCMTIFTGGFDSSATVVAITLYEIAKHPEVQDRILDEIDEYLRSHDNTLGHECISELPYVMACIEESLRLYPVVGIMRRQVTRRYTLPCGAVLDKGVRIHIPTYHTHRDPRFFPDPEEFRPERFLPGNREKIKPYTYLPFGEGPRMCIGMRFAKILMIPAMITVLKQYRLEVPEEMPRQLELVPVSVSTLPKVEITLRLVEREGWQQRQFSV